MLNKALIIGSLGKDPELKHLPSGGSVVNFSVATKEVWNDKASGKKQEKTEWHNIVVFGKQAENCAKFLSKGSRVFVEGKIQTRSWDDKDGNKRYTTEVNASDVKFLTTNSQTNDALKSIDDTKDYEIKTDTNFASDDVPF
jgi:single-strand DNA-binding protein